MCTHFNIHTSTYMHLWADDTHVLYLMERRLVSGSDGVSSVHITYHK